MISNIGKIIKILLYLLTVYLVLSLNLDLILVYAQTEAYYAGYYYTHSEEYGRWGVEGYIYTADMDNVSWIWYKGGAEWVCIVLSYKPLNWIQVGYQKVMIPGDWWPTTHYYVEKNDTKGHDITYYSGPSIGSTHLYYIINENAYSDPYNPVDPHYWLVKVDPDTSNPPVSKEIYVDPFEGVDMQALIEIHDSGITVHTSHFYHLKLYNPSSGWILWDTHENCTNPLFVLKVVYDYEFYAKTV